MQKKHTPTSRRKNTGATLARLLAIIAALAIAVGVFVFDLNDAFDIAWLKSSQAAFQDYYENHPVRSVALYFVLYVAIASLSLPGAAILTVAGGAMFGFLLGSIIVSFASAIGATFAFLISRHLLRDWAKKRFAKRVDKLNRGVERGGAFYLFSLRLVPALPYFVTNMGMGLTNMRVSTYYWVSQVAMLAGTMVYVNAGTHLAEINSLQGIMSPGMVASFVLLALFPLAARFTLHAASRRRAGSGDWHD